MKSPQLPHKYPPLIRRAAFTQMLSLQDKRQKEGLTYEDAVLLQLLYEIMDARVSSHDYKST